MMGKYPVATDACSYCRGQDSNANWLIWNKTVNGWVCERCRDDIIIRKNQIIGGMK